MLYDTLNVNEKGNLTFCGYDTVKLAADFATPAYFLDTEGVRKMCRLYMSAMGKAFGDNFTVLYASKALSYKGIYRIINEEGLGTDVVSGGELYTALAVGFPAEKIYFHGNNTTEEELTYAIKQKIGCIVCDSLEQLSLINKIAVKENTVQKILLRITPGIDPHTHKKITTGTVDSKFGMQINDNNTFEAVKKAMEMSGVNLCGFHCHIGSQISLSEPYCEAAIVMLGFIKKIKAMFSFETLELNIGGGFAVRYTKDDEETDYGKNIESIAAVIKQSCFELGLKLPKIIIEPGRSIVAQNGITLYTAGSVKEIPGVRNYVSVNGGMTDNPRFTLYQARYTVINASKADKKNDYTACLAGRCCESGDILAEDAQLAKPDTGDIIAVLTTGAYNYSMASNYNRIPRAALIELSDNEAKVAVKRESYEDIVRNDM